MNITQESSGKIIILSLTGRLDTLNFPVLDNTMNALFEKNQKDVVIDCEKLDYVSSSGLRVLFKALKEVKDIGGRLVLCSLQPQISQIFKISGFDHLFEIFQTKSNALASFN